MHFVAILIKANIIVLMYIQRKGDEMFKVDSDVLRRCSTQLNIDADALSNKAKEIDAVCDALSALSGMEIVIESIRMINECLRKEVGFTENLSEAAERIAHKYELTEERIVEVIENSGRNTGGGNVSLGNFSDRSNMNSSVNETLSDIDRLIK